MKPRLGIHCPGTGTGGPWRYVHSLLKHIDTNEFEVIVFSDLQEYPRPGIRMVSLHPLPFREGEGPAPATIESDNRGHTLPQPLPKKEGRLKPLRVIAGFLRSAQRLARIIAPHDLDIFHTQNTGCEEAPLAARLARVPHIVGTFHTDSTYDLHHERGGWHYRFLERVSNRSLHVGIAVSHATGRDWRKRSFLPSSRIVTIHNGIDADTFVRRRTKLEARIHLDLPRDAFLVAGLGRLDEAKGFADLIDAAAIANVTLAIAGDGPLKDALKQRAIAKNVDVRWLGFLSDVQPLLDAADMFALPSLCEACPYAVLEALAAELPVLGSDVGGVSELIRGVGIVLPPRDPHAWATAITALKADRPSGTAGRQRVEQFFREDTMAADTFDVYRHRLGKRWD